MPPSARPGSPAPPRTIWRGKWYPRPRMRRPSAAMRSFFSGRHVSPSSCPMAPVFPDSRWCRLAGSMALGEKANLQGHCECLGPMLRICYVRARRRSRHIDMKWCTMDFVPRRGSSRAESSWVVEPPTARPVEWDWPRIPFLRIRTVFPADLMATSETSRIDATRVLPRGTADGWPPNQSAWKPRAAAMSNVARVGNGHKAEGSCRQQPVVIREAHGSRPEYRP